LFQFLHASFLIGAVAGQLLKNFAIHQDKLRFDFFETL